MEFLSKFVEFLSKFDTTECSEKSHRILGATKLINNLCVTYKESFLYENILQIMYKTNSKKI